MSEDEKKREEEVDKLSFELLFLILIIPAIMALGGLAEYLGPASDWKIWPLIAELVK